jgi:predicted acyl esterase
MRIVDPSELLPIDHFETVWITLSDSTKLAARIWHPKDAISHPCPAILEYLPYRRRDGTVVRDSYTHPYLAGHGYACIRVDMRGTGDSDGVILDEYLLQEQEDALEVIDWISKQAWCSGSVAMMGISWGGFNSLQVAARQPPALKAIISLCSTDDRYGDDIHYKDGILLAENAGWGATAAAYMSRPADPGVVTKGWKEQWLARLNASEPWIHIWMRHPLRDAYWKHGSIGENPDDIKIPVLLVGGWDDSYASAMVRMMKTLPGKKRCIMGPWAHKYPHFAVPGPEIGFLQEVLRWCDQYLKGIDTGVEKEPLLCFYQLDSFLPREEYNYKTGQWYGVTSWPPVQSAEQTFSLSALVQDKIQSPANLGENGGEFCVIWLGPEWPTDQTRDDARSTFIDIDVTDNYVRIVGAPVLDIKCKSDQPEAHIFVRLCDVAPDGTSTRITYGALNLTHNETHSAAYAMTPNVWYTKSVTLNDIAYTVPKGHKLRIALSTQYWPMFVPPATPVTLTVDRSKTNLRVNTLQGELIPYTGFQPSEGTPGVALEIIKPSSHHRYYVEDNDGYHFHKIVDDFGVTRNLEHNGIAGESAVERHRISTDGKHVTTTIEWNELVARDATKAETQYSLIFEADESSIKLNSKVTAHLNGELFFEKTWEDTYPRNHLYTPDHKNVKAFLRLIEDTCAMAGVKFLKKNDDHVMMREGNVERKVPGYFDWRGDCPVLCYATRLPFEDWFAVALLEFYHMEQWLEKFEPMMNLKNNTQIWKSLNREQAMNAEEIRAHSIVELDAVKRAHKAIVKYQLPIDPKLFAKKANAYIYAFQYAEVYGDWLSLERAPYKHQDIIAVMPDHFDRDYHKIDHGILALYHKHYANTRAELPKNSNTKMAVN